MSPTIDASRGPAIAHRSALRLFAWAASAAALAISPATTVSAQVQPVSSPSSASPTVIVIGFVGGFVRNDDERHPEVQIVQRLSEQDIYGLHAAAFENRRWERARNEVLHWLDADGDGRLSPEEKQNARIVLFGHSWGGSAAIKLARDLNRRGIPVLLTIEVDSVNKLGGDDCLIPPNVGEALNFYQTRGLVHGCRSISAADPQRTRILGNDRFEYSSQPAACSSYSWTNRHVFKTHEAMDCDPRVWSQVDRKIDEVVQSSFPDRAAQIEAELATAELRQ
jgi:pimeloyl-ACP methyl ester carboxylesterase